MQVICERCARLLEFREDDLKTPAIILGPKRVREREWERKNSHAAQITACQSWTRVVWGSAGGGGWKERRIGAVILYAWKHCPAPTSRARGPPPFQMPVRHIRVTRAWACDIPILDGICRMEMVGLLYSY